MMPAASPVTGEAAEIARVQRRTVRVLAAGQVLGGIAFGATVSLGALLAADLSGKEALSGLATASVTLGASRSRSATCSPSSASRWSSRPRRCGCSPC